MTSPLPKRYGKQMPTPVDNGGRICFQMMMPDALEYRAALMGQLNDLGFWFTWDHIQADYYNIPEKNQEVAQLWLDTVAQASFEVCMEICEQIINCIQTDTDVQNALSNFISEHPTGTTYPKDQPLPAGASAENILASNPDCELDILWSQCIGLVQTANRMIVDFLETWETYNNGGEIAAAVVNSIPGLAGLSNAIGISGIIEYANDIIDAIRENYDSDYTLAYEQQLACEIFCAAKNDCSVSIDDLCTIINARIGGALNTDNLVELLVSLVDADVSGFNVADLYMGAFFNLLKIANLVIPVTWGIEAYTIAISIFNEPNDDWEVLCTDCPEPTEDCLDFISGTQDVFEAGPGSAQWYTGKGWGNNINSGVRLRFTDTTAPEHITKMTVRFYRSWDGATANPYYDLSMGQVSSGGGTAPVASWGIGADPPHSGQEITVDAAPGTYWLREDFVFETWASSFTWPGIGGNDAPPQYIAEICFNEGA